MHPRFFLLRTLSLAWDKNVATMMNYVIIVYHKYIDIVNRTATTCYYFRLLLNVILSWDTPLIGLGLSWILIAPFFRPVGDRN